MKGLTHRCLLTLCSGCLLILGLLSWGTQDPDRAEAFSPPHRANLLPNATFHLWQINEIFTCPDGSTQFVELATDFTGQEFLAGHELRADGTQTSSSFFFPFDMPPYLTPPVVHLLIATSGFENLSGGVVPDYILPPNFISTDGGFGSVSLIGASALNYGPGELPLDGIHSLNGLNITDVNSPQNFAGQQGSIRCPPVTKLYVTNNTNAGLVYTVKNTPEGDIVCNHFMAGFTVFCGSFTPGTYTVEVNRVQCGLISEVVTFPLGDVTRTVICNSSPSNTIVYLPLVVKPLPLTYLYIRSISTGGIHPVEIRNPIGNALLLSCVIGNNVTQFCGSFSAIGTYTIIAYPVNCPKKVGTFPDAAPGANITRTVQCP